MRDDRKGQVLVDVYRFGRDISRGREGRRVVNEMTSCLGFRDGLIEELRALSANRKLNRFLRANPVPLQSAAVAPVLEEAEGQQHVAKAQLSVFANKLDVARVPKGIPRPRETATAVPRFHEPHGDPSAARTTGG